jgi:hypothetical protein
MALGTHLIPRFLGFLNASAMSREGILEQGARLPLGERPALMSVPEHPARMIGQLN